MANRMASKQYSVHVLGVGTFTGSYTEFDDASIQVDSMFNENGTDCWDEEFLDSIEQQILEPRRFGHEESDDLEEEEEEEEDDEEEEEGEEE